MSIVTSVIVTCPLGNHKAITVVNQWLDGLGLWALKEARESGGNKAMQAHVFTGAYGHYGFSLLLLLDRIRDAPWERDDLQYVRVFVQEEDDETFTERLHATR